MDEFQLNDDDVVLTEDAEASFINSKLFKIGWFKKGFERFSSYMNTWLNEGVDCEMLQAGGGGWRKGKLRLRLEFIPDEPNEPMPEPSDVVRSPNQ
jgi:hypothetical protein